MHIFMLCAALSQCVWAWVVEVLKISVSTLQKLTSQSYADGEIKRHNRASYGYY